MFFSPLAILNHLQIYLPRSTDLFSNNTDVSAEIIAGTPQILRITKTSHGYQSGDEIITANGLIDNPIISVTEVEEVNGVKTLRFETNSPHDLIEEPNKQILLAGFTDSSFNTTFDLIAAPSRNLFEIESTVLSTLTGSEVLREFWENGIDGKFVIDSVTNDTFDILLTDKPVFNIGAVPQLQIIDKLNIAIAADWGRAAELYTNKNTNDPWLFINMDDCVTSKDRKIESDAIATNTAQNPQRLKTVNGFTLNVIIPTINDLSGSEASQKSWTDIYFSILTAMAGVTFETFDNSNYVTTLINHGSFTYNNAYYVHSYAFEYVYEITDLQTFLQNYIVSRASRDLSLQFSDIQDGSEIKLDE